MSELVVIDRKFGYLTVIDGPTYRRNKWGRYRHWECICKCGAVTHVREANLLNGHTRSCGCYCRERAIETLLKHGESARAGGEPSPEWKAWNAMRRRCSDPLYRYYKRYGGRGIKVCQKWLDSYSDFLADVGRRPGPEYSLDRINVDGDYCPENCKWSTREQQSHNKSNNVTMTYNGQTLCIAEWAKNTGFDDSTLRRRLKDGWTPEKILTTPVCSTAGKKVASIRDKSFEELIAQSMRLRAKRQEYEILQADEPRKLFEETNALRREIWSRVQAFGSSLGETVGV